MLFGVLILIGMFQVIRGGGHMENLCVCFSLSLCFPRSPPPPHTPSKITQVETLQGKAMFNNVVS